MRALAILTLLASLAVVALPAGAATTPDVIRVGRSWTCSGPVDVDLVRVTNPPGDAIVLAAGCTGRIGRIEVDTRTGDGVKILNQPNSAHDVSIGGGYVKCTGVSPSVNQDAVQALGGTRISFSGVTFDCLGTNSFFVTRAGSGGSTPAGIVCSDCRLGAKSSPTAHLYMSVRSGVRSS